MPTPRITILAFFVHVLEFLEILLFRKIVALYWYFKNSGQCFFAHVKLYKQIDYYRNFIALCNNR